MIKQTILKLPQKMKIMIMIMVDYGSLIISFYISSYLLFRELHLLNIGYFIVVLTPPLITILLLRAAKLYSDSLRYMHVEVFFKIFFSAVVYSLLIGIMPIIILDETSFAIKLITVNFFISTFLLLITRLIARWYLFSGDQSGIKNQKVLIYGAGEAGIQLVTALINSRDYRPVAFIDDNQQLLNTKILGLRIYPPIRIHELIKKNGIKELLIAIPSLSQNRKNKLLQRLEISNIKVKTLPSLSNIVAGRIKVQDIKNIEIEDILSREIIEPIDELMSKNIRNKVVLITGAGGSIGSEIARQVIKYAPKSLIILDQNEFALYSIEKELRLRIENSSILSNNFQLKSILGSLDELQPITTIFRENKISTIYHTAAYKHVPIVEANPIEGVNNNIFVTVRLVIAAMNYKVKHFVYISTDKSVRPASIMGATKRFSEMILQALAAQQITSSTSCSLNNNNFTYSKDLSFSVVRFGNVINSSGSVIPLFKEQIARGGPVTVTDPDVIRYFMSTEEAAGLVIQSAAMSEGGDIYVLDMGDPISILEVAKKMIHFYGYEIDDGDKEKEGIKIIFTGLRPGEKLFEELHIGLETQPTDHPKILKAKEKHLNLDHINNYLALLQKACEDQNITAIYTVLEQAIPEAKLKFPKKDTFN